MVISIVNIAISASKMSYLHPHHFTSKSTISAWSQLNNLYAILTIFFRIQNNLASVCPKIHKRFVFIHVKPSRYWYYDCRFTIKLNRISYIDDIWPLITDVYKYSHKYRTKKKKATKMRINILFNDLFVIRNHWSR